MYVSSAAAGMGAEELEALALTARDRSVSARLTGLLVHHGPHFYAIIEGPRRRVFERVEEIIAERGQRDLRILREEAIRCRRFSNWSFGTVPAAECDAASPSEFLWRFCGLRLD